MTRSRTGAGPAAREASRLPRRRRRSRTRSAAWDLYRAQCACSAAAAWASSSTPRTQLQLCRVAAVAALSKVMHPGRRRQAAARRATFPARSAGHGRPQARPRRHDLPGGRGPRRPLSGHGVAGGRKSGATADGVGPLPAAEVLRVGREIAEGLEAAHSHGLIHRDVKPSNVWLEAGRGRVKILDFGLASPGKSPGDGQLTQEGLVVGIAGVHGPRTGQGSGARQTLRPVQSRLRPLPHVYGPQPLRQPPCCSARSWP